MSVHNAPPFKYATELAQFEGCPPPSEIAKGVAFRVVHDPIRSSDFVPKAMQPRSQDDDVLLECSDWGLSMFTSAKAVQDKFGGRSGLLKKYPRLLAEVGEYIAKGTLDPTHGKTTRPGKRGHFDLHEFVGADVAAGFDVVEKIVVPTS